jgi:hypothetical protein
MLETEKEGELFASCERWLHGERGVLCPIEVPSLLCWNRERPRLAQGTLASGAEDTKYSGGWYSKHICTIRYSGNICTYMQT